MKTSQLLLTTAAAAAFLAVPLGAQTTISNSSWASVRAGNPDVDENAVGYVRVAYASPVGTTAAKGYFEFDTTGTNPNTNAHATFTFDRYYNSGATRVRVWILNQAYPGMATNIEWATAQANDAASNDLLTNGPSTATFLEERFVPGAGGATPATSFTLPAPWGHYVFAGKLVMVVSAAFDSGNDTARFRISITSTNAPATNPPPTLTFAPLVGAPPSISALGALSATTGQNSATNTFTVGDPEDGPDALVPVASSSNPSVVPTNNVFFGGSGATRTVHLVGATNGTATITVSVTDSAGNVAHRSFLATIVAPNLPPVISTPAPTNTLNAAPVTIPFVVGDAETAAGGLTVTGAVASLNRALLSDLSFGGADSNRSVTVTPAAGQDGVGLYSVSVSDPNTNSTTVTSVVMVLPSTSVVFAEHFDYPAGVLNANSAGFWTQRVGGSVRLRTTNQQALIRSSSSGESAVAPLANGPYSTGLLFYGFRARWSVLPGNSSADLIHLYDGSGAFRVARLYTSTNNTAPGFFRLMIANIASPVEVATDLTTNIEYRLVMRYDIDGSLNTGFISTRLWVDPTDAASPSTDAFDTLAVTPVSHIGLRQNTGMGEIYLDDLKVGRNFADVYPPAIPVLTRIEVTGGVVTIDFRAATGDAPSAFSLVSSVEAAGPYGPTSGSSIAQLAPGSFQATAPVSSAQGFFRISR